MKIEQKRAAFQNDPANAGLTEPEMAAALDALRVTLRDNVREYVAGVTDKKKAVFIASNPGLTADEIAVGIMKLQSEDVSMAAIDKLIDADAMQATIDAAYQRADFVEAARLVNEQAALLA